MPVEAPPAPVGSPKVESIGNAGPKAVPPPSRGLSSGTTQPMPESSAHKSDTFNDAFGDLDRLVGATPKTALPKQKPPQPPPKKKGPPPRYGELPKPNETQKEPQEPNPDPLVESEPQKEVETEEPGEQKPAETKEPETKPQQGPKELRTAYETLKTKADTLEKELSAIKAERAKPVEDPEKKSLFDRVQAQEKRLKELDEELKYAAYERSPEYTERYEKPFIDAYHAAREKVGRLKVNLEDGSQRQAAPEDFDRLIRIQDDDQAAELAHELFGAKATMVIYHREHVQNLMNQRNRAVEDFRKNGSERFKQAEEQATANQLKLRELWSNENQRVQERYEWFKPKEGDDEGNKLLEEGYVKTDLAFSQDLSRLPIEEQVKHHAAVRNRAAAFGRLVFWNKQLNEKVAELEKELAEFRDSSPGGGEPETPGNGVPAMEDWESRLEQLAK